ncbi:MAG: FAD-dependent monooxygenase, partial [Stackebrandtia sp.]
HVDLPGAVMSRDGVTIPGYGLLGGGHNHLPNGVCTFAVLGAQGPLIGTMEWDDDVDDTAPMTLDEIRASLRRVLGTDITIAPPTTPGPHYLRRNVGINTRIAERYRAGRVLLVGDAAHVHSAVGGPGLNLGTSDAVNLGWKLAAQVNGWAPRDLLDSYQSERYPVGQRVQMHSLAQLALLSPGHETSGLRGLFGELLRFPDATEHIGALLAGTDIRYDTGDAAHRWAGRFVPDLMVTPETGPARRLAELMRRARPLLVNLSTSAEPVATAAGWRDRVDTLTATASDVSTQALLIRPDGYVAWASDDLAAADAIPALSSALHRWFGEPDVNRRT